MGALENRAQGCSFTGFATDSGEVKPGDLFIAIKGQRVDGHEFVPEALSRGACAALVERPVDRPHIRVRSVVEALANFGKARRATFQGPVIGVTGSAGKTTTKEFISAAIGSLGPVLKSAGNRNTEYTSPLLWADLTPETKTVVVEMAMRGFGQISHLAEIAKPTIGVVTNVGYAHVLQVGNREGIAKAKGELLQALPKDGLAILWQNCEFLSQLKDMSSATNVVTFGNSRNSTCQAVSYQTLSPTQAKVRGIVDGHRWSATLPAIGHHLAIDAACAILTAYMLGVTPRNAAKRLESVQLPGMRMEVREWNGITVVLDTYNASPPSMIFALATLYDMTCEGRKFAILGEMRELGAFSEEGHQKVGGFANKLKLAGIGLIGSDMRTAAKEITAPTPEFLITPEDRSGFMSKLQPGDVLLIKGSRALELEKLLE